MRKSMKRCFVFALLCIAPFVFIGGCGNDNNDVTITIDDGDAGFVRSGPAETWQVAATGYQNDSYWVVTSLDIAHNSARWTPNLDGDGTYEVKAYIPREHSTTAQAIYTVVANGVTSRVTINQSTLAGGWVSLGQFNFADRGTEYVELTDLTGEVDREISFDAMMFDKQ